MSNLDAKPTESLAGGRSQAAAAPIHQVLTARDVPLGESTRVRRLLPNLGRRMVGAWCFVDHYGPDDVSTSPGMQVGPHPHMGLQTVTWLLAGEVLHRDSIGSLQPLRPGQLGLMTSGRAIAHAEQSPPDHPPALHGVQLWVALPDSTRNTEPSWKFHDDLPAVDDGDMRATVILGEFGGKRSPGVAHTPLVGVDIALAGGGGGAGFDLETEFEYAALVTQGDATVDGVELTVGQLLYLGCGRSQLEMRAGTALDTRLLLLGGVPFEEQILMWWNFVARDSDEIAQAREEWAGGDRFGEVHGYPGDPIPAPPLPPGRLKPRGRAG